jgi:probable F420-dependent oxidoreductase
LAGVIGLGVHMARIPFEEAAGLARLAEDSGFTRVCCGDNMTETFTIVGGLGAVTRTAQIHTSIVTWTRTPVITALAAATSAQLTKGRFALGLGTMPKAWSEDYHGIDYSRPIARMRDYVGAIRAALVAGPEQPADYEGEFYSFRSYRPLAPPTGYRIPITLGVIRPQMSRLAGEIADGVVVDSMQSIPWIRDVLLPRFEEGLRRSGRTRGEFELGAAAICAVAEDRATARDLARGTIAFYLVTPYLRDVLEHHGFADAYDRGRAALERGDREAAVAAMHDGVVDAIAVTGTPDDVREQVSRFEGVVDWLRITPPHGNSIPVLVEQARRLIETLAR